MISILPTPMVVLKAATPVAAFFYVQDERWYVAAAWIRESDHLQGLGA